VVPILDGEVYDMTMGCRRPSHFIARLIEIESDENTRRFTSPLEA
jgi:hypothetical protein